MDKITIEICCGSVEDAVIAYEAGASRIELNSAMLVGGLTPSIGMLKAVKERCKIPVICMVRPRPGGFCYSPMEFETMLLDSAALMEAGADGLAFGVLDENGFVDTTRNRQIAEIAGEEAVFHRAFDALAQDHQEAFECLISSKVTRILTSGGEKTAEEGIGAIKKLVEYSDGKVQILPGGGVRGYNIMKIIRETGVNQAHLSFHKEVRDPSAGKNPKIKFSPEALPAEEIVKIVDREGLAEFIKMMQNENAY